MPNHATWLPEQALPELTTDPSHMSWLSERGSLTARLREVWGAVAVDVIGEGLDTPLSHEADRLCIPAGEAAWVRCVWLRCHGQARVYARTVIPRGGPLSAWVEVQQLGRQPLGELLFQANDLERSAFEWCGDAVWPSPLSDAAQRCTLARRCVFRRGVAPLLLTEVFLDMKA